MCTISNWNKSVFEAQPDHDYGADLWLLVETNMTTYCNLGFYVSQMEHQIVYIWYGTIYVEIFKI